MKTTNSKLTARLGDVVRGEYHEVAFQGRLTNVDGNGYLSIELSAPIMVFGIVRGAVCLGPWMRAELEVIERPELTERNVSVSEHALVGVSYVAARAA